MKPPRPVDEPSTREVDGRLSRYPLLEALIERRSRRFGEGTGTLRDGGAATSWRDGSGVQAGIPRYSDEAVAATIAYCEYVYRRYGRFPADSGPFRTVLAHQAHRPDPSFYDRFYRSGGLTETPDPHRHTVDQRTER